MTTLVGKRIGEYQVMAMLGEGGMATVYRARRSDMDHDIALKIIQPDLANTELFTKRFEREAQTVAALDHPHILKIVEYGTHKKTFFIATELLTGGSLDQLLRKGPLPLEAAQQLMEQLVSALAYAHQQGIVHRDLKPQNVMLNAQGEAVLTDFGLAKLVTETISRTVLTQSGAQIGTPAYMSPEQWKGDTADVRSDVYGLGLLLFEMLTGSMAFKAENAYDLMHKHLYMPPPSIRALRPELPIGVEHCIRRALAKDRIERYQSVVELQQAFQEALVGERLAEMQANDAAPAFAEATTMIVSPSQAAQQESEAIANIHAEQQVSGKTTPTKRSRLINPLPQDVGPRYIGRAKQVADITNLLTEKTRLVSIYGRGGVGKTALACKALGDLLLGDQALDGLVCLSAASTEISLDRILTSFGKLLGGDDKILLDYLARDRDTPASQKVAVLLEKLAQGQYILLLDNLETLQDSTTGALTDPDLQSLFDVALEQGSELRLLITSREPLALQRPLKTWERLVPLDEGLPVEESIALLRACDPDNSAGLRDASLEQLQALAEKTAGFPRALEAIAGMLLEDPLLSVDSLVRDVTLLSGEITALIVQRAITRLSPDALRVMEALALFERPVTQPALAFLLAPYLDTSNLRAILARLVSGYFVIFNKATQQFALHAIDREYCYQIIPAGSPEDRNVNPPPYTRYILHARAAEYYKLQRKPQAQWLTMDDLTPQLAEFEQRLAAEDYDEAARVLLAIDRDYLWEWGQQARLTDWHRRLRGRVTDPHLAQESLRRYAWTQFFINRDEADTLFEQLLQDARRIGDRQLEADALDDLAQTLRRKSDLFGGLQRHEQAYEIYKEIGDRRGQAEALGGMGACASFLFPARALGYLEEAAAIQTELKNIYSLNFLKRTLGQAYLEVGRQEQAITCLQEALNVARNLNNLSGVALTLSSLGQVYAYLGRYEEALDYSRQAVVVAEELAGKQVTGFNPMIVTFLAVVYGMSGNVDEGIQTLRPFISAVEHGEVSAALVLWGLPAFSLLKLLAGEVQEARKLIEPLLPVPLPPFIKIWQGVIAARASDIEAAMTVFRNIVALTQAAGPDSSIHVLYPRALAQAGLGLLARDEAEIRAATEGFRQARAVANVPGYLQLQLRMIDQLMLCPGGEILAPVRTALTEELG